MNSDEKEITREEKVMSVAVIRLFGNELTIISKEKDFTKVIKSAMSMQGRVTHLISEHIGVWEQNKLVFWLASTMADRFCRMIQEKVTMATLAGKDPAELLNEAANDIEKELQ